MVSALLDGTMGDLAIYPGILRHPRVDEIPRLLSRLPVARRYTILDATPES